MDWVLITLLLVMGFKDFLNLREREKLVNKIMSKNYQEYEYSKALADATRKSTETKAPKENTEMPEDLSPIHGFGLN